MSNLIDDSWIAYLSLHSVWCNLPCVVLDAIYEENSASHEQKEVFSQTFQIDQGASERLYVCGVPTS